MSRSSRLTPQQLVALGLAMLVVMTLSFVEIPFWVEWLRFDATGVVSMLAALVYGPIPALVITVLGWLPHLFFIPLGTLIAAVTMGASIIVAGSVHRARPGLGGAALGTALSMAVFVALALLLNLLITPLYNSMSMADVAELIPSVLLPFNLIKAGAITAATLLLYRPAMRLDRRLAAMGSRQVPNAAGEETGPQADARADAPSGR